ncbi:PknH-like extracellular domain-containing protein [Actinacidiphila paucisporea]|uniref:PknH-like extracellular domain-containing protein n=1 Tax=Actinacidiphila paucisporea TaxID=310782 RepID=A0A1M7F2K2_9ACTN|nr:PknH-like extracellular domain-containing protein [Actinacidiphila paucisporea]
MAAAALLPALALATGCGGGGGDDKPGPVASGAVPIAKLTSALLTSSDVPHVQVLPAGSKDLLLGAAAKADVPACQPVVDQWTSRPKHPRQVYTGAMVTDTTDPDKGAKAISLTVIASYKVGDAKAVLDDLTAALAVCHDYAVTRGGVTTHFQVKSVAGDPGLGDQRVSYTIGDTSKGAAGQVLVTVIRAGETTAAFETVRTDHKPATLRRTIPVKQVAKLRTAAKGN